MWPFPKTKPLVEMIVILVGLHLYLELRDLDSEAAEELGKINPIMPYMFFFDRVVGNMSDLRASYAIETMLKLVEDTMVQIESIKSEQEWEKERKYISTGEKWNLVSSPDKIEEAIKTLSQEDTDYVLRAKATIYLSEKRMYCNTEFSNTKDIESATTLSLKAIFIYLTAKLSLAEYVFYFLPAFHTQLVAYGGKKPSITNLGEAVTKGLQYGQQLREKHFGKKDS